MHDPRTLLQDRDALARRGYVLDADGLADLLRRRTETTTLTDRLRSQVKRLSRDFSDSSRERGRELKEELRVAEDEQRKLDDELTALLLTVPNPPYPDVPDGHTDDDAVEVRRCGTPPAFDFEPLHHADLGERTGILDLTRAGQLSGARFSVTRDAGAALERALAAFFLDVHTREHGYVEYSVPTLVTRETMTATGQLPKFSDDLFRTAVAGRELFLIPTAEVPLTNLFAGRILDAADLPLAVTAHTPCFRAEAGSYGRDTRGILRLHEFSKVELVRICDPASSRDELLKLVAHAETLLQRLGLAYRVVQLAAGDLGFSARVTYDLEVWLPSQQRYREVSSCSDCGTLQSRRAAIRIRDGAQKRPAATLNGSGLPIGRTLMAIMEQYQRADGGIDLPEVLHPYTGFRSIAPDGTPVR